MTNITNKRIQEHTFTGNTLEELFLDVIDSVKQGKLIEINMIHAYVIWDEEYGWVMKVMESTHDKK